VPYTDCLNEGLDDLTALLTTVTGLRVVNDPTKLIANCAFIDAPSFDMFAGNGNVLRMNFPVKVIGGALVCGRVWAFCAARLFCCVAPLRELQA